MKFTSLGSNKVLDNIMSWTTGLIKADFWRSWKFCLGFTIVLAGVGLLGFDTFALTGDTGSTVSKVVAMVFGGLLQYVLAFMGWILLGLIAYVLLPIAQYNDFVNAPVVVTGWFIIRDVVNMFYILILLVIAFSTILSYDKYSWEKNLVPLLFSAIIINFSRTICGLFIDLSQVVMLTFVNAFAQAAGGNFAKAFKIDKLMTYQDKVEDATGAVNVLAGYLLAIVMVGFSIVIIVILSVFLIMRIIWLWLLVTLSPLAFFANGTPFGFLKGFYGKWWDEFNTRLIGGPMMAFFLWLALTVAGSDQGVTQGFTSGGAADAGAIGIATKAFDPMELQGFFIAICLMYAGIAISQKFTGIGMSAVKSYSKNIGKKAVGAAKFAGGAAAMVPGVKSSARAVEGMAYGAVSRIPGLRTVGAKALAGYQSKLAQAGVKESAYLKNLTEEQRERLASGATLPSSLMSPEQKGKRRELLAQRLDDLAMGKTIRKGESKEDYAKRQKAEYLQTRREYQSLAKDTHDGAAVGKVLAANSKRPDFIIDPEEKDPKVMDEQRKSLAKTSGMMGYNKLIEADASALTPELLMGVSPKALKQAHSRMNGGQQEAIRKVFGDTFDKEGEVSEKEIRDKQKELKMANADKLSNDERERLAKESTKELAAAATDEGKEAAARSTLGIGGRKFNNAEVAEKIAAAGQGGVVAKMMSEGKLDVSVDVLSKNPALLQQVSASIDTKAIGKLPEDVRKVIQEELKKEAQKTGQISDIDRAVDSGVRVSDIAGVDAKGQIVGAAAGNVGNWVGTDASADIRGGRAAKIGADEIRRGGKDNDIAKQMVLKLDVESLNVMAKDNAKGAAAVVDAASGYASMDIDKEVAAYGTGQIADEQRKILEELKNTARKLVDEIRSGNGTPILGALSEAKSDTGKMLGRVDKDDREGRERINKDDNKRQRREFRRRRGKGPVK